MDSLKKNKKCEQCGRTTHWTTSGKWMSISQSHVEIKNGGCNSSPLITFKHFKKTPHSPFLRGREGKIPTQDSAKRIVRKGDIQRLTLPIALCCWDCWHMTSGDPPKQSLLEPHDVPRRVTESEPNTNATTWHSRFAWWCTQQDQGCKLIPLGSKMPTDIWKHLARMLNFLSQSAFKKKTKFVIRQAKPLSSWASFHCYQPQEDHCTNEHSVDEWTLAASLAPQQKNNIRYM